MLYVYLDELFFVLYKIHMSNYGIKSVLYNLVLKNMLNFITASTAGSSTISSSANQSMVSAA